MKFAAITVAAIVVLIMIAANFPTINTGCLQVRTAAVCR